MRDGSEPLVSDSEIEEFVALARNRAGADEMLTPREIIRDYLSFLNVLRDNKNARFSELIRSTVSLNSEEEKTFEPTVENTNKKVSLFDIDI